MISVKMQQAQDKAREKEKKKEKEDVVLTEMKKPAQKN